MGWPDKIEYVLTNHSQSFDVQCRVEDRLQTSLKFCIRFRFVLQEWAKSVEQTLSEFDRSAREEFFLEMMLFVNYPLMRS